MRRMTLCALALACSVGCQRLNWSATKPDLGPKEVTHYLFDAPTYEQHVTVSVKPVEAGVSAYLVKQSDVDEATKALDSITGEPAPGILLGSKASNGAAETYSFTATVPAKVPYALFLRGGKKTTAVTVSVAGK